MIGFVADPSRVDYWMSGENVPFEELKKMPIWNTFSEERKKRMEEAVAQGPERLKKFREQVAEYERRVKEGKVG